MATLPSCLSVYVHWLGLVLFTSCYVDERGQEVDLDSSVVSLANFEDISRRALR